MHVEGLPLGTEWRNPVRVGLLFEGGGVAFLGADGRRVALPVSRIASIEVRRVWAIWPPRTVFRIWTSDGGIHAFAVIDAASFRRNREATVSCATRLQEAVATRS
jgi:hypothetical protein